MNTGNPVQPSQPVLSEKTLHILQNMLNNEATDQLVYARLARRCKGENQEILEKIAQDEAQHCEVWARYTGASARPLRWKVWLYTVLGTVFGITFVINLMESGESDAAHIYESIQADVPEALRIMEDENRHEAALAALIDEEKLHYIGSMMLGLNDALVELTGALAGFTLALGETRMVALAGFITGVAATLSMATSEYLSKKADPNGKHPLKAAIYTGIAYMITVTVLLTPYAIFSAPLLALGFCLFGAACIIFCFTFFVSVVHKTAFLPAFREMICISFSVAAISFLIGWAARIWLALDV